MNGETKFVDFATYCPKCAHWTKKDTEDPCNQCMCEPTNEYSRKPVMYEPADNTSQ